MAQLPTHLVVSYRAVDREVIGSAIVDAPAHLDQLTEDIERRGILVPLELAYNDEFGCLDGNHRIAVAVRLGIGLVPVRLKQLPLEPRPAHAQTMHQSDFAQLERARRAASSV